MLAGVIFDLDGTLGETLPVCFEAFRTVLRRFNGEEHTDAAIRAMFGPTEEGILLRRVPHAGHAAVDAYLEAYRNLHSRVPEPFDGIRDLLATLDDRNVRMAVVTGKGAGSAAISLDVWGLGARFTHVAAGSDDGNIKDRNMAGVIADWGVEAADVVSIGDAPSDIIAARSVGIVPVGAAWASTTDPSDLVDHNPAAVFESVGEFATWIEQR